MLRESKKIRENQTIHSLRKVVIVLTVVIAILAATNTALLISPAMKRVEIPEQVTAAPFVAATKHPETTIAEQWAYELTDAELEIVTAVVAAEAMTEDFVGVALVAQCIVDSAIADGIRPDEVVIKYQYADPYQGEITESVRTAVLSVFKMGMRLVEADIQFFYSPLNMPGGVSEWHESLDFVVEHGGHRFFALSGGGTK